MNLEIVGLFVITVNIFYCLLCSQNDDISELCASAAEDAGDDCKDAGRDGQTRKLDGQ